MVSVCHSGHRISFLNNRNFIETYRKYGFVEIILDDYDHNNNNNNNGDLVKSHPIKSVPVTQSFGFSFHQIVPYDQLNLYYRNKNENCFCKLRFSKSSFMNKWLLLCGMNSRI